MRSVDAGGSIERVHDKHPILAQFFIQILPTILSAVSGSPDSIGASLKEAG
jgi:hypothetical protein